MLSKRRLLSQNFIKDKNTIKILVDLAHLSPTDTVIEIGPGEGSITRELENRCKKVIAVEIDGCLVAKLQKIFTRQSKVRIVHADIRNYALPEEPFKVFSNIPFSLTADIVYKLLYYSSAPQECYLIMQKEAAEKFSGQPFSTQFSVLAHPWFSFEILWRLKKSDFYPPPHVDTVLLKIKKREAPLISEQDRALYTSFIKYAFGQWKRNLKLSLKRTFTYTQWKRLAHANHFRIDATPSELTANQWLELFKFLIQSKN